MNILASQEILKAETDLSLIKGKGGQKVDPKEGMRKDRPGPNGRRNQRRPFRGYGPRFYGRGPRRLPPWFFQNRRFGRGPPRMQRPSITPRERDFLDVMRGRQDGKLEGEKAKQFDEVSAQLYNHNAKRLNRPPTAFQTFVEEKRKDNPKITTREVQVEWDKLEDKELRREKAWNAFQEFLAARREHNKKRIELVNELRALSGRPKIVERDQLVKGFDIFWKEVEAKVKETMPKATAYELQRKRQEMWRTLDPQQKRFYILQSVAEREKMNHARRLAAIENRIQVAKDALVLSGVVEKVA